MEDEIKTISLSNLFNEIKKEFNEDIKCIREGKEIDFRSKFKEYSEYRDPDWKWYFKEGDWIIIHSSPDEYYLSLSDINTPYKASRHLWDLKSKQWFTREDADNYVSFINSLFGWNYSVNSLMKQN